MSERSDPHAADGTVGPHGQPTDHGGADGHGNHGGDHSHDDHGHGSETEALGPLDARAWGAGLLGILLGLAVAVAFLVSNGLNLAGAG